MSQQEVSDVSFTCVFNHEMKINFCLWIEENVISTTNTCMSLFLVCTVSIDNKPIWCIISTYFYYGNKLIWFIIGPNFHFTDLVCYRYVLLV